MRYILFVTLDNILPRIYSLLSDKKIETLEPNVFGVTKLLVSLTEEDLAMLRMAFIYGEEIGIMQFTPTGQPVS